MTNQEFNRELVNEKPSLFSFTLKLTQNYQDAQDLFQDSTTRAFRYCSRFRIGTSFRAWMSTIIRNTFNDHFRARQRRQSVNKSFAHFQDSTENKQIPLNQGEVNIRVQEILQMLDAVDDLYSVPFMMHYQGFAYKEISDLLDLPIGTVKSRLYTARQTLQQMIKAENEELPEANL